MPLTFPSKLGQYQIVSQLGSGGMGEVYRARDERLGRDVALKLLREEHAADADRLARFGQEARSASALNHPSIVTIFEIGEAEGRHFIAMELVRGRTIRACLERGPLSTTTLLDFAVQIADGLARAHEAGIVHRDLKPDNLMVTDDGLVKILDFGLAKLIRRPFDVDSEGETLAGPTRSGTLLGTVGYMSPEQASGDRVDHRTDQFTFGLVLHEMATGERPFDRRTAAQTMAAIIEAEAPSLDSQNKSLPAGLSAVVARCLSKAPERRFDKTRDLALALREIRDRASVAAMVAPVTVLGSEKAIVRVSGQARSFQVQVDGRIKAMSEKKLRAQVRSNSFSGLELVRREGEDRWELLHDSSIFGEEIPLVGDPRDAARWRMLESLVGHVATFVAVGAFMSFPPWMAFWGIGLASHVFKAMPAALGLLREGKLRLPGPRGGSLPALGRGDEDGRRLPPADFMAEVERVRSLLTHRDKDDARGLLAEIDRLVASVSALTAKLADLEEQTSRHESERLQEAERQAQARLETAAAYDRDILTRHLEVLGHRRRAMEKALELIERMRLRRSMAEHQLKQLRLDLSQAEARRMEAPELSSRILDIRDEVDALDEVDELLAHG